jgi:hypothetical protein
MTSLTLIPVLAAPSIELIKFILIALIVLGGPLLKKITDAREQAERAKKGKPPGAKPPAVPPRRENSVRDADATWNANSAEAPATPRRENPFRNEIEQFLEEVGRRRPAAGGPQPAANERRTAASAMPRPVPLQQPVPRTATPMQRNTGSPVRPKSEPPKTPVSAAPQTQPLRPGTELAQRKAPVSDDLGAQVRAHLTQYLDSSRMSERARADLGSAVERAVRDHMGTTTTAGTADQAAPQAAADPTASVMALLRDPAGVRAAIVVSEILERPRCLRRNT